MKIEYSRGRLWLAAFFSGSVTVLFAEIIVDPQIRVPGIYGLLINSTLGHNLILPGLALVCLVVACRCAIVASGSATGIVTDASGATITTLWKTHRVVWSDLLRVRLSITTFRRTKTYSLEFDQADGGTISLPLTGLAIPKDEGTYRSLLHDLSDKHVTAIELPTAEPSLQVLAPRSKVEAPLRPSFGRKIA